MTVASQLAALRFSYVADQLVLISQIFCWNGVEYCAATLVGDMLLQDAQLCEVDLQKSGSDQITLR